MLLRNIIIGKPETAFGWRSVVGPLPATRTDKNKKPIKTHSLVNHDLRQKVVLDSSLPIDDEFTGLGALTDTVEVLSYKFGKYDEPYTTSTNVSVNFNNLRTKIKECEPENASELWYVTINSEKYQLISFTYFEKVVGTYRKRNSHQGCSIIVPVGHISEESKVLSCILKEHKSGKFVKFTLSYSPEKDSVAVYEKEIVNPKSIDKFNDITAKYGDHELTFRVNMKSTTPVPKTIVVLESLYDKLVSKLTEVSGADIISRYSVVRLSDELFDGKFAKPEVTDMLKLAFGDCKKPRAVTFVGFKLPSKVTKELNLNYIFGFDVETGEIFNIKS